MENFSTVEFYTFLAMVFVYIVYVLQAAALPNRNHQEKSIYNAFGLIALFMLLLLVFLVGG